MTKAGMANLEAAGQGKFLFGFHGPPTPAGLGPCGFDKNGP